MASLCLRQELMAPSPAGAFAKPRCKYLQHNSKPQMNHKLKRNLKWLLLLILPIGLGFWLLVLREQRSWLPRVIYQASHATNITMSSDGNWLAVQGGNTNKSSGTLLIDAKSGVLNHTFATANPSGVMCFSPDSSQIVIGNFYAHKNEEERYQLTFTNIKNGKIRKSSQVKNFSYDPYAKLVWRANDNWVFLLGATCIMMKANSGQVLHRFSLLRASSWWNDVELSPDGTTLASVRQRKPKVPESENTAAHLWDARDGKLLRTIGQTWASSKKIAFSHDGNLLAADVTLPKSSMTIQLWNLKTGKALRNLKAPTKAATSLGLQFFDYPRRLQFSPTENLLAIPSFPDSIVLWNADTGKVERTLKGTARTFLADFCFSSDGKFLVTAMNNGAITRWRIR